MESNLGKQPVYGGYSELTGRPVTSRKLWKVLLEQLTVVNPEPFRRDFILMTLTKFKTDRMTRIVVGTAYDRGTRNKIKGTNRN